MLDYCMTFCETRQLNISTFCLIYDALDMNRLPSVLLSSRCRYNLPLRSQEHFTHQYVVGSSQNFPKWGNDIRTHAST